MSLAFYKQEKNYIYQEHGSKAQYTRKSEREGEMFCSIKKFKIFSLWKPKENEYIYPSYLSITLWIRFFLKEINNCFKDFWELFIPLNLS